MVSFWRDRYLFGFVGSGIGAVASRIRLPVDTPHCGVCWYVLSFGMSSMSFVFGVTLLEHRPCRVCGTDTTGLGVCQPGPIRRINRPRVMDRDRDRHHRSSISGSAIPEGTPLAGYLACFFVPGLTGLGISLTRHYPREHIWPLYGSANLIMACVIWFVIDTVSVPQESIW